MTLEEPRWLTVARGYVGAAEVPGKVSNPLLVRWWLTLGGASIWHALGSDDSSAPWCGTFVAAVLREAGVTELPRHWYRARAWIEWGRPLVTPSLGCIVVYERTGGGHVGFVVGRDRRARILTLGGNQGDRVSVAPFEPARVIGYRWPPHGPMFALAPPLIDSTAASSTQEA